MKRVYSENCDALWYLEYSYTIRILLILHCKHYKGIHHIVYQRRKSCIRIEGLDS